MHESPVVDLRCAFGIDDNSSFHLHAPLCTPDAAPAAAERPSRECAAFAAAHDNTPHSARTLKTRGLVCIRSVVVLPPSRPLPLPHNHLPPHARSPANVISTSEGCTTIKKGRTAAGYTRILARGSARVWDAPRSLRGRPAAGRVATLRRRYQPLRAAVAYLPHALAPVKRPCHKEHLLLAGMHEGAGCERWRALAG
ncbi:hypothetical protein DFH09DRAFT_1300268 [Mycena vulgaris]|nr:hypothetical protein DFH09DRAFT_1300268 [Mycena vulgaris]